MVLALVVGMVEAVQLVAAEHAGRARADASTGTAGLFVPLQARLLDTRNGTGGYSTPLPASTWSPVTVLGAVGMPSSNVSAVQVTVTAVAPAAAGGVSLTPSVTPSAGGTALFYRSGATGTFSNTAIVAVGPDGKILVFASTSINLILDIQGYYTAGSAVAPGGYAAVQQARIADTINGTGGLPVGKVAAGGSVKVQAGGVAGVPADASAVFVNVTVTNYGVASGWLVQSASGNSNGTGLNYPSGSAAGVATAIGTTVPLAADGSFQLAVGPVGSGVQVHLDIMVEGYFDTAVAGGAFTPASARVLDTRVPNTPIPAGGYVSYQIGGVAGVPLAGSGISAVFVDMVVINGTSTAGGYMRAWASDQPEPNATANINYLPNSIRSNAMSVRLGADGKITVHNLATFAVNLMIDLQGWYSSVGVAVPAGQSRTQENLTLKADASVGGGWVSYQYRVGITGTWANVPVAEVTVPGTSTHPAGWPVQKSGSPAAFAPYTWDAGATLNHGDQLFQVKACYGSSSTDPAPVCSIASTVQLATHSFGDSYATDAVGPGSVSLLTGDYQLNASDVSVPTYQGSLSIGRSFTTLTPAGERGDASGIFGPGWSASLPGTDAGSAALTVSTAHLGDGYISFTGSDGGVSAYQATSPTGSYPISFAGVDDAAADGSKVVMASASEVDMFDTDGTKTVWTLASGVWGASSVVQPGSASTTSYTRDSAGRVTRILGAVPTGVSCASPDTTPGCRSLTLNYTTLTVGGVSVTRLQNVTFHSYDPATSAMASVLVASYDYDVTGRLADSYDPRISPNLKTAYTYDGNGRLASLTPPGLAPWTFSYDSAGRLATVARYDSVLAQSATNTVVYGVAFTGSGAPIELGASASSAWGQSSDLAAVGTAVFGPDHLPASSPTSTDWPYASLHYLDVNGRETNTASYGAGAWQYGATSYDSKGNVTSSLTPGNRAQALSTTVDTDPAVAAITDTAARAALLSSVTQYDPLNPDRVIDSYGPAHPVVLNNGSTVHARSHQHTSYDEGAPLDTSGNPKVFGLPTTVTSAAWDLAASADQDSITTKTDYAAVAIGGSKTGWDLRQATSVTKVAAGAGGTDLVSSTRYNDAGQSVQSWLPASTGSDAKSTSTSYYTAGSTGTCVATAFAGLACTTGPSAQPGSGNPLPVKTISYNLYDQALTATETAGSTVRSTTTTFDAAGRPTGSSITVTPTAAGGTALPAVTTSYHSSTGLPTTTVSGGKTLTTSYDTLGRVSSYTDATGNLATTSYDIAGRPMSVNDGKGITSFTYDSATEHRGLVTAKDVGVGAAPGVFTASYNADGAITTQTYPNGLTSTTRYDNTADAVALSYAKSGSTWMSFTQASNAQGNTATQTSPMSSQAFSYDSAGRLIQTKDSVTSSTGPTLAIDGQVSADSTSSGGTVTTPSLSTTGAGTLIALVSSDGPATANSQSVTVSGAGLSWSLVSRANASYGDAEVWKATSSGALSSQTVTATQALTGYHQSLSVVALKGAAGVGTSGQASAASGAPTLSLTSTAPGSLMFATGNDYTAATPRTLGTGQSMLHEFVDTANGDDFWAQRTTNPVPAAGTAVTLNSTAPTGHMWNQVAVEVTQTAPTVSTACTTRAYTLDADSNRTTLTAYPPATGGACSTSTTPTVTNSTYDGAERITNTGYSYDTLGRTSTVPAADAQGIGSHAATTGALTLGYYSNDLVATQTQGSRTLGFTLDPTQNRFIDTTDTAGTTSTNHYADSGDSPAWTNTGTNWTRNLSGISGGLAATVDQTGTVVLQLANLHGDLVATQTQGSRTLGFTLDPTQNRRYRTRHIWLARRQTTLHQRTGRPHPHGRPPLQPHHRPIPHHRPRPRRHRQSLRLRTQPH